MKTDDLIRALANDRPGPVTSLGQTLALALLLGLGAAFVVFMALLGPRPDIAAVLHTPRFLFKFVVTLAVGVSAVALVLRLARPETQPRSLMLLLWIGPALLALGVILELAAVPAPQWSTRLIGSNSLVCLSSIPLIAAPLLIASLVVLKRGAPTKPVLAGAVAGLAAGGLGATLYAAHCADDSPLFVMAWYTPAVAAVTGVGAAAGSRLLRW
jgi:hypothetical protein